MAIDETRRNWSSHINIYSKYFLSWIIQLSPYKTKLDRNLYVFRFRMKKLNLVHIKNL